MTRAVGLLAVLVMLVVDAEIVHGQGLMPRGRSYDYALLSDSSTVTLTLEVEYADSTLYEDVDSTLVRFDDVIVAQWPAGFEDGLVRYWRNTAPENPPENEIQLVGFSRPGLRVFYDPPLPWVPAITDLEAAGQWTWSGRVWPDGLTTIPDTLHFQSEILEPVVFLDGSSIPAWKFRMQEDASFPVAGGERIDPSGARRPPAKRFEPLLYWFGPFNDGGSHRVRMRDDQLLLMPDRSTPLREESMGGLRARFAPTGEG